jgi:hypothetical protein
MGADSDDSARGPSRAGQIIGFKFRLGLGVKLPGGRHNVHVRKHALRPLPARSGKDPVLPVCDVSPSPATAAARRLPARTERDLAMASDRLPSPSPSF